MFIDLQSVPTLWSHSWKVLFLKYLSHINKTQFHFLQVKFNRSSGRWRTHWCTDDIVISLILIGRVGRPCKLGQNKLPDGLYHHLYASDVIFTRIKSSTEFCLSQKFSIEFSSSTFPFCNFWKVEQSWAKTTFLRSKLLISLSSIETQNVTKW